MSLSNQVSTPSRTPGSEERSKRNPSSASLSSRSPTKDNTTPEDRSQVRGAKTIARPSKVQKPSSTRRAMSKVVSGSPALAQSPLFESMPRATSSTSDDSANAVRLTKTGRVSKALKGEPVHKCNLCDKVYTRNEHLRADLLNRHKEEQYVASTSVKRRLRRCPNPDQLVLTSPNSSSGKSNSTSDPSGSFSTTPASGLTSNASPRPTNNTGYNTKSHQHYLSTPGFTNQSAFVASNNGVAKGTNFLPSASFRQPLVSGGFHDQRWGSPTLPSPDSGFDIGRQDPFRPPILESYYSPEVDSYNFYHSPAVFGSDEWLPPINISGSRSPASASSSVPKLWHPEGRQGFRSLVSPTGSDLSAPYTPYEPNSSGNLFDLATTAFPAMSFSDQDAFEEHSITSALSSIPHLPRFDDGRVYLGHFEERYLSAFWQYFDPIFSIIHKPTFDAGGSSELVKALMVAIGAQYLDDECAKLVSRTLRETCLKLLSKRPSLDYTMSRLWDLQAVFLAEAFSLYCSRRPSTRFSPRFEGLLAGLLSDRDNVFFAKPLDALSDIASELHGEDADHRHVQWVHLESKRRLLLSCFVLETQQSSFFGSERLICDRNLPMPCSAALWSAFSIDSWLALARQESMEAYSLSDAFNLGYLGNTANDAFSSNIAIAYFSHGTSPTSPLPAHDFLRSVQQTPQGMLYSHGALLTTYTPVRDLLAVSGETFVMGEKLATRDQYVQAISDLRSWVGSDRASQALVHARHVLRIAVASGRIGLLHEDWTLYLATLVCWACRMWPVQEAMHDVVSAEPVIHRDVDSQMKCITAVDDIVNSPLDWQSARTCLEWTRRRMIGRLGGLLEDATGVLGKLVEGRCIDVEPRG
ncbi:MAG: hypothetical protein M1828_006662 [Chrysothrix sp. TS-e1954]|nr:MAG: hypothetical protein M1828_006662 [Chrysothrix sp. TS-e1954]